MDLDEAITIAQLDIDNTRFYLMIGWQAKSFQLYLYSQNNLWHGKFSSNRLAGFSRNLQMSEESYYASVKLCLSEQREDYNYELRDGFFYWKRNLKDYIVIEGFVPVELDSSQRHSRPDLIEVLMAINTQLKYKISEIKTKYETVKKDYQKCLKDTEEFLNLKIDMERALCDKFLNTLNVKKDVGTLDVTEIMRDSNETKVTIKVVPQHSREQAKVSLLC
ncbi:uncharacterized protein [Choristoneura fumiferana]|uniref:uncharacterized protein n=1 Tax=Choristoneura fumiferana TaxID=7141 RepID=UPI003D159B5E